MDNIFSGNSLIEIRRGAAFLGDLVQDATEGEDSSGIDHEEDEEDHDGLGHESAHTAVIEAEMAEKVELLSQAVDISADGLLCVAHGDLGIEGCYLTEPDVLAFAYLHVVCLAAGAAPERVVEACKDLERKRKRGTGRLIESQTRERETA